MKPSPILQFYQGGTDDRGRTLAQILAWSDDRLEFVHDYIQWMFPLPERSAFNHSAPTLTAADIAAFAASVELREQLLASFRRILAFYGFALAGAAVVPAANHAERLADWLHPGNHNLLRITRILRCLTLLGLQSRARAFLAVLEPLRAAGPVAQTYWRNAAFTP